MAAHLIRSHTTYTAKGFGQQTDSKWSSDVWTGNGYKSAHASVCALKQWTTACCPFAVQRIGTVFDFFSYDTFLHSPKVLLS